jgi:hypothetical protein
MPCFHCLNDDVYSAVAADEIVGGVEKSEVPPECLAQVRSGGLSTDGLPLSDYSNLFQLKKPPALLVVMF